METTEQWTTVIIGQGVSPGREGEYETWQRRANEVAATYPGFLGCEVKPPTRVQPDWTCVYRFDSLARLQAWMNSSSRQTLLDEGSVLFDGPATQQILTRDTLTDDTLVTVVVTHRVRPEEGEAFLAWHDRLTAAERHFTGFRGSELFRPIAGVQEDWTALYRFDTAENLDAWLKSAERQQLLEEGDQFEDFELRQIDSSFGNWFSFDSHGDEAPPPGDVKTSVAIWVGLYPTVMVLSLILAEIVPNLKLWQTLLIGNLLSSFSMTYLTMPRYVNRLFRFWLRPAKNAREPRTNLQGIALVVALQVFWAVLFFLVTDLIWKLP